MNKTVIVKRVVDVVMYVLFLVLMGQYALGGAAHEWLGIAVGILFVVHNALNYKWYLALFRGKYDALRIIRTVVNFLLIVAVVGCAVSGILVSRHIFSVQNGTAVEFGRALHLVSTAWAFVLMSLHLGLHRSVFVSVGKKLRAGETVKKRLLVICRVLVLCLFVYGLFLFVGRRFWEELFFLVDYQKEYDFRVPFALYLFGSLALSSAFVSVACLAEKTASSLRKRKLRR